MTTSIKVNNKNINRFFNLFSQDTVGVSRKDRHKIKQSIFGAEGVTKSDETTIFNHRLAKTAELWKKTTDKDDEYFEGRISTILKVNFESQEKVPWVRDLGDWTNNNCESINHVLKTAVDWQKRPLTSLVSKLKNVSKGIF